jgi:ectoine hydroxylase-related dioxygenase (phytanoyl-CoA dioxygenase family)
MTFLKKNPFIVKSIYFDKPPASNWFVAYHQDIIIAVKEKKETPGFNHWTVKPGYFQVQAPVVLLEKLYTIRIHLDDTTSNNGALKILPKSHLKGILRSEAIETLKSQETVCEVSRGGIMLMKPLLMHSSGRTTNHQSRRVIHIEITNAALPNGLNWAEKINWDDSIHFVD